MQDHVNLDAQQVSNGVAQWEAASSELNAALQNALNGIRSLSGCWGKDGPGCAFEKAYMEHGGPEEVLFGGGKNGGQAVVKQVVELGTERVPKAVGSSLAGDEQQAVEMLIPPVEGV